MESEGGKSELNGAEKTNRKRKRHQRWVKGKWKIIQSGCGNERKTIVPKRRLVKLKARVRDELRVERKENAKVIPKVVLKNNVEKEKEVQERESTGRWWSSGLVTFAFGLRKNKNSFEAVRNGSTNSSSHAQKLLVDNSGIIRSKLERLRFRGKNKVVPLEFHAVKPKLEKNEIEKEVPPISEVIPVASVQVKLEDTAKTEAIVIEDQPSSDMASVSVRKATSAPERFVGNGTPEEEFWKEVSAGKDLKFDPSDDELSLKDERLPAHPTGAQELENVIAWVADASNHRLNLSKLKKRRICIGQLLLKSRFDRVSSLSTVDGFSDTTVNRNEEFDSNASCFGFITNSCRRLVRVIRARVLHLEPKNSSKHTAKSKPGQAESSLECKEKPIGTRGKINTNDSSSTKRPVFAMSANTRRNLVRRRLVTLEEALGVNEGNKNG